MNHDRVSRKGRILVWSNEEDVQVVIKDLLDHEGYETMFASEQKSPDHAMRLAATVVDLPSYETSQVTVVRSLWARFPGTPMVILTGHDHDEKILESLFHHHAWHTIRKPYDSADLKQRLHEAIENGSSVPSRTGPNDGSEVNEVEKRFGLHKHCTEPYES
jgi:DNA-binding NtrC family response regulator